jgi:hypothetical protein
MAELQSYLREEPNGVQVEKVKKALAVFQSRAASSNSLTSQ